MQTSLCQYTKTCEAFVAVAVTQTKPISTHTWCAKSGKKLAPSSHGAPFTLSREGPSGQHPCIMGQGKRLARITLRRKLLEVLAGHALCATTTRDGMSMQSTDTLSGIKEARSNHTEVPDSLKRSQNMQIALLVTSNTEKTAKQTWSVFPSWVHE